MMSVARQDLKPAHKKLASHYAVTILQSIWHPGRWSPGQTRRQIVCAHPRR